MFSELMILSTCVAQFLLSKLDGKGSHFQEIDGRGRVLKQLSKTTPMEDHLYGGP
jgi:hypothetical protein